MSFTKLAEDISGTQTPSSVHSFLLPDPLTHHHKRWGDWKRNILLGWPKRYLEEKAKKVKQSSNVRTDKKAVRKLSCIMHSHIFVSFIRPVLIY